MSSKASTRSLERWGAPCQVAYEPLGWPHFSVCAALQALRPQRSHAARHPAGRRKSWPVNRALPKWPQTAAKEERKHGPAPTARTGPEVSAATLLRHPAEAAGQRENQPEPRSPPKDQQMRRQGARPNASRPPTPPAKALQRMEQLGGGTGQRAALSRSGYEASSSNTGELAEGCSRGAAALAAVPTLLKAPRAQEFFPAGRAMLADKKKPWECSAWGWAKPIKAWPNPRLLARMSQR